MKTSNSLVNEHTNHLNNMSMVHDTDSVITQAISYIPYGEVFVEQQADGWSSPYLFNAKELDSETGLYYYGARYLDPSDAMWLSVDPLWEKYVGMTSYQYCMGNPVKLVDTDGRIIKFAPNCSNEFKTKFAQAIKYLHSKGANFAFAKLQNSERTYYICELLDNEVCYTSFNSQDKVIKWNPNYGLETENGNILSPTAVLNHEACHTSNYENAFCEYEQTYISVWNKTHDKALAQEKANEVWNKYLETLESNNKNPYGNKEEERNITISEQFTAKSLGELKEGTISQEKIMQMVNL